MSMSPIRTVPEFDDEEWYNAQIERELERIEVDEQGDQPGQEVDIQDEANTNNDNINEEAIPETMRDYLSRIQEQSDVFERELGECDHLLNHQSNQPGCTDLIPFEDEELLRQAAAEQGLDPEDYKTQILAQMEQDDDDLEMYDVDELLSSDEAMEPAVLLTEVKMGDDGAPNTARENHTRNNLATDATDADKPHQTDNFVHENGVIALVDPTSELKEFLKDQWLHLDEKEKRHAALLKQDIEVTRWEEEEREKQMQEIRQEKQKEMKLEEERLAGELKVRQAKLEEEETRRNKEVESELQQYEHNIHDLGERTRMEQEEFQQRRHMDLKRREERRVSATSTIQATYRGHRVRKVHGQVLREKKAERMKLKEEERIKEMEIVIQKREEQAELKKQQESERREDAERKRLQEEERKIEEERKRKEDEDKKRREEEDKKKQDEERKRQKEEEDRKRKEKEDEIRKVEEKKRKEAAERKQQEEENRLRKELEERKREEEEDRKRKEEEERKRKEEEDRKRKEEEERKKQEERRKQSEEQKRKEEADRLKKEKEEAAARESEESRKKTLEEKELSSNSALLMGSLPDHIEKRRLEWMKDCVPWSKISNEPWKTKLTPTKKPPKRPSSAKKLSPLAEQVILSAARATSLRQVTTVQLEDLPGCNLSTLGQCWGLKHLVMTNCGLIAVDGLDQCKELQYLDVQHNQIQYVDLKDLGKLQYVNLSSNNLTMIHGFEGCANVRWMDLSSNKITKIGNLFGLRRLHTLRLSRNQLINTKGLGDSPTLQTLDLSHNHLQSVDDIHKLCLLQQLSLTGNNLLQAPRLENHVLLQELLLDDNSITSLDSFTECWLPCLHCLNMAHNSLSDMGDLKFCLLLKELDVRNNQLLDGEELVQSLTCCKHLENLSVEGNPGVEDTAFRNTASSSMVHLKSLDGQSMSKSGRSQQPINAHCSYEVMCLTQVQVVKDTWQRFQQELVPLSSSKSVNHGDLCELYFHFCDKAFRLAVEHRYAHEYGDVTVNLPSAPKTPKLSNRPNLNRAKNILKEVEYMSPKDKFDQLVNGSQAERTGKSGGTGVTAVTVRKELHENDINKAAVMIQSTWRGYFMRKELCYKSRVWMAATKIQAVWRGYLTRLWYYHTMRDITNTCRLGMNMRDWTDADKAAVKIQALWRGYNLRRKLMLALDYARLEDDDDDEDYGEVDLEDFNFNEADLDMDWKPPPTPHFPTSHAVMPLLGKPPSGKLAPLVGENTEGPQPYPPAFPRQAWRNLTSPLSNRPSPLGKLHHPPSSLVSGSDTHRTGLSKKEEQLSEEWGFKDIRTAELMMQRAKKMKYNADKKKKLSKLDPKQKLALFRKLQETTKLLKPIQGPMRRALPRKEYFQARAQEIQEKEREKRTETVTRVSRTFEWLHTQVGDQSVTDSCINQHLNRALYNESESSLPRLDEEITAGRRVQLVGSPIPMDLESVGTTEDSIRPRRYSMDERLAPNVNQATLQLPPIKTNSAPSNRVKERISRRNPKKETDVGWGGGKKRVVRK